MRLTYVAALALLSTLFANAADLVYGETLEQTAKRTGYSVDELKRYFPPLEVKHRLEGLAKERFKAPPRPYVHPRVFFNPEDVAAHRSGLRETVLGRRMWAGLNATLQETLHNPASKLGKLYQQLADGRTDIVLADRDRFGLLLAQESSNVATIVSGELARVNPTYEWQYKTGPMVAGDGLARAYDFAYNWMSEAQRKSVRAMLYRGRKAVMNVE